jgi:photosystem II stability/assembly factor-like uncharacterized protein
MRRGQQTVYIRPHGTLEPFAWAGACSALGGIRAPIGDVDLRGEPYDLAALFPSGPAVEVEAGPDTVESSLTVQKAIRAALVEEWLSCRWDVDVRYQECPRRDDPDNWVAITRLCKAKFLEYASDGDEAVASPDDDGVALVTSGLKALWPLVHMWQLTASTVEVSAVEDFTSIAVCEAAQCMDAVSLAYGCVVRMGTTGFYGSPQVYLSDDAGETWESETLSGWSGDVDDIDCLGDLVVVVSSHDEAIMWTDGTSWTEVSVASGRPWGVRIFNPGLIVVVGEDGRIWRSTDRAATFVLVDDGTTTTEHLYHVDFVDREEWWAIGDDNAILRSEDGAETWSLVTGPVAQAGVDVTALLLLDENCVLLGYADGELWYTDGAGETWEHDASVAAFDEIGAFAECGCGRVMVVGYDADGNGLVYENVHGGAPGHWQQIAVPAAMGAIADVVCCDANTWLAVGSGVYLGGAIGQVLKIE